MSPSVGADEPEPVDPDQPAPLKRGRSTQDMLDERKGPGFVGTALRTLIGLLVVVALLAVVYFGASALEGDQKVEHAPWAAKSAPDDVVPASLVDQ